MATTAVSPRIAPRTRQVRHEHRTRSQQRSAVRLTLRGRVAAFTASVVALMAVIMVAGQVADAADTPRAAMAGDVVVVQAGDTLWAIAQDVAPGHDPRAVINAIRQANDLGTAPIVPGQALVLPAVG